MADTTLTTPLLGARPARTPQYIAAFSATLGSFVMGSILGYTSPAGPGLTDNTTDDVLHLTQGQYSWFSSLVNVGSVVGGPVGGLCLKKLGRRGTMMASALPAIGGWILIGIAQNFAMLLAGRLLTGLFIGMTSAAVPTYIGEYASADIRGALGSWFPLMITLGHLLPFGLGAAALSWRWLAILSIIPVVLHVVLMFFAKESPSFLLYQGKEEQAATALQYFRGKNTHIQTELDMMRSSLEEYLRNKASCSDLRKAYIMKPFFICLSLMFFQQFSDLNGIYFNLKTIFISSGAKLSDDLSTIIVVLATAIGSFLAIFLVDRAGRKLLLIASSSIAALSLVALGEFFYLKTEDTSWTEMTLGWLPLLSIMLFFAGLAIGLGSIPYVMLGEMFSPNVREVAAGQVIAFGRICAFVVTYSVTPLQVSVGDAGMYWIFAGICTLSLVFCVTLVPETKGKTLEEITASFGGPALPSSKEGRNSLDC